MKEKFEELLVEKALLITALSSIIIILLIIIFVFSQGLPAIESYGFFNFIFGSTWNPPSGDYGILPMIVGSLRDNSFGIAICSTIIFTLCHIHGGNRSKYN